MKIGIGLSCYNRHDCVSLNCKFLSRYLDQIKLVVADDGSLESQDTCGIDVIHGRNKGVATNKNRLLNHLKDCDYIFVIEDDVEIRDLGFVDSFLEYVASTQYQALAYGPLTWSLWNVVDSSNGIHYTDTIQDPSLFYVPGTFMALTKQALKACGGLNSKFFGLGLEHMEWSWRLSKMGFLQDTAPNQYFTLDLSDSLSFFDVPRNPRDQNVVNQNCDLYFSLLSETPSSNKDYLVRSNLHLKSSKVFGLGLSKTGTNTLTDALGVLGYDLVHYPLDQHTTEQIFGGDLRLDLLERNDGITDITTVPYYKQLDQLYPGSKFIFTERDRLEWIRSLKNHWHFGHDLSPFEDNHDKMHPLTRHLLKEVYGGFEWDENEFLLRYDRHAEDVRSYFESRKNDLLIFDVAKGWGELCEFMGCPIPVEDFPYSGVSRYPIKML